MRITVVGAGIIGLSCGLRLHEAGHAVHVVAAAPSAETTSSVAAALWYPYRALPEAAVTRWAAGGFAALRDLAEEPASGVRLRPGRELFRAPAPDPWWRDAVPAGSLRRIAPEKLPQGYADGWELTVPVVDMETHLDWVTRRLHDLGVSFARQQVSDLDSLADGADVVVNCTGLGARDVCGDDALLPVRGQVVIVEQVGLDHWTLDQSDPQQLTYVVPRSRTIVLGGTADEDDEDLAIRPDVADQILARCAAVAPQVAHARVLAHRVGLRPARPSVRLEPEHRPGGLVVHCYGHGGAGVTLAYGCADDVVRLLGAAR